MLALPRLLFLPLIGLALLTACDPRSEEEASLAPAQDLSPNEIIQRILEAEKSINSVREERTDISTQLAAPMGDVDTTPQESRSVRIQVGEDSYSKYEIPELLDFCRDDAECLGPLLGLNETLVYNDNFYYRDRSGTRWVTEPESFCLEGDPASCGRLGVSHLTTVAGTGGFVDCPAMESIDPVGPSQIYSFDFSWLTNLEQVEDGSDGTGLTHIRAVIDQPSWPFGLSPEIEAAYAECGIDLSELYGEEEIPAEVRESMPDRLQGVADLWVDPGTFFIHRLEWSLDMLKVDRLVQSDKTSARYSLFNEAELPGPLPE